MNTLLTFWKTRKNYRLGPLDAKTLLGITNLEKAISELRSMGIPIKSEIRYDLGESAKRYWIDEEWREGNK